MTYLDDVKDEHAALREENARLTQELEDRRTLGRIDQRRIERTDTERDRLRAHVAALVQAGHEMLSALRVPGPMPATIEGKQALMERAFEQMDAAAARLRTALDAVENP